MHSATRGAVTATTRGPYEAIELTGEGANPHVSVLADKCNGCGACESVCVSLKAGSIVSGAQERAIVVKPIDSAE